MARSRVTKNTLYCAILARSGYPTSSQKSRLKLSIIVLASPEKQLLLFSEVRPSTGMISASQEILRRNVRDDSRRNLRGPYERRTASTMGTERKSNVIHMNPFKTAPSAEHLLLACIIMPHDQKRSGILTNRVITVRSTTS
jgi:hypothetical protein